MSSTHLAHHFSSAEQQMESSRFGLWIFLTTEVLLFGGLFVAYTMFRALHPVMFAEAHHHLDKTMGTINTIVLICSSLTMALGVHYVRYNQNRRAILFLSCTLLFATTFMVIKYFEYSAKFEHHLFPADVNFAMTDISHGNPKIFFSLYFLMTGLHGIHVLIGMGLISWITWRTMRRQFSPAYYTPVELTGLYWHFVDVIWIYLFPLLYLIA